MKDIDKIFENWDEEEIDPNGSPLTDEKFVKFLKDRGLHDEFIKIYNERGFFKGIVDIKDYCNQRPKNEYVNAFGWNQKWENVNHEWNSYEYR